MSMDTLVIHRRLIEAGAEPKLAEAIASSIVDVVDGRAASKADLREAVKDLRDSMTVRFGIMFAAGFTLLFLALEFAVGR